MAHNVICAICKEKFDRDIIQATKYNAKRYAHHSCFPEGELVPLLKESEDPELTKLKDYIRDIYGDFANWPMIVKQIQKYRSQNISYNEIELCIKYFYEILKNDPSQSKGGIGIISYILPQSKQYWFYQDLMKQKENKRVGYNIKTKEITIQSPKPKRKKMELFELTEGEY